MKIADIKPEVYEMAARVQKRLAEQFAEFDAVAEVNTRRVMEAFQNNRVSDACFAGTTGYGYDDLGREVLDKIYAEIFGTEAALVRINFVNGTHALTAAMFSLVKPGDKILAVTGMPYDTLRSAIGISGDCHGSLKFYGVEYGQVDLTDAGEPDYEAIAKAAAEENVTAVMIQRSRGYADRKALTVEEIGRICSVVKEVNPNINIMVDNCYGEFTDVIEPTNVGADIIAGSLIKNPGGGIAPTGGYIAGRQELVDNAAMRLTTPGIGGECGSTNGMNRSLYQGFFMAPHITAQALKTAAFCSALMGILGYDVSPVGDRSGLDIIHTVNFGAPEKLLAFCRGIQAGSPVDSYVTPEAWAMPGYDDPVVMAAGAFIQGSSIELSCDGPMRPPYAAFIQGGLTYESGKLGILSAVSELLRLERQ